MRVLILPFKVSCHKITLATHFVIAVDLAINAKTFFARCLYFGLLHA